MANSWIDLSKVRDQLSKYLDDNSTQLSHFGNTVNQTFEAFVFAATLMWYQSRGWSVTIEPPEKSKTKKKMAPVVLKFSTRGQPSNYSYAICSLNDKVVHVRHQLRVATKSHSDKNTSPANICLDVAIYHPEDLKNYTTDTSLPNSKLISFGEAKHMPAFAELIASFVGIVHELKPNCLKAIRKSSSTHQQPTHPAPFLYVSGHLNRTAEGILETINRRGFDIDVWWETNDLVKSFRLPKKPRPKTSSKRGRIKMSFAATTPTDEHGVPIKPEDIPW